MNSVKHTPGPWKVVGTSITDADQMASIATANSGFSIRGAEAEANARLIAAAPELLAALKQIEANAGIYYAETISEIARAAIAKARGES